MKITNENWGFQIDIEKSPVNILVIESPSALREMISDIIRQCDGEEGSMVLSEDGEPLTFKNVELVIDPFSVDINNRKILNKLYDRIEKILVESDNFIQFQEVKSEIERLLESVSNQYEYPLIWQDSYPADDILKLVELKLNIETVSLEERIMTYIDVMNDLCGTKLFVFVNVMDYIEEETFCDMVRELEYQETGVIFIESREKYSLGNMKTWIIDKNLCEIYH